MTLQEVKDSFVTEEIDPDQKSTLVRRLSVSGAIGITAFSLLVVNGCVQEDKVSGASNTDTEAIDCGNFTVNANDIMSVSSENAKQLGEAGRVLVFNSEDLIAMQPDLADFTEASGTQSTITSTGENNLEAQAHLADALRNLTGEVTVIEATEAPASDSRNDIEFSVGYCE